MKAIRGLMATKTLMALCLAAGFAVTGATTINAQESQTGRQHQGNGQEQGSGPAHDDRFAVTLQNQLAGQASERADERQGEINEALLHFYEARGFESFWFDGEQPNARARALLEVLGDAYQHGLRPENYGMPELAARISNANLEQRALIELELTQALIEYASDVRAGLIQEPRRLGGLYHEPNRPDPNDTLIRATASDDFRAFLDRLPPRARRYDQLREALAQYREIAEAGGWPAVPEGAKLELGVTDPRVAEVRARLRVTGELTVTAENPELYDETLKQAVETFQERHGLAVDGVIGPNTLAQMNVPVEHRIRQIIINLERRRWTVEQLGNYYIFVNIADNYLKVVENDETIHVARVVVGQVYHKTPIFSKEMVYARFNPYWNVPYSIATQEMLPRIKENPGYLIERNYLLLTRARDNSSAVDPRSVDWSRYNRANFPFFIRQKPGPGNALGTMIFMFPNRHNVFIHDTASRSGFQRNYRFFSHGCIRVENPHELAMLLLGPNDGWSRERLSELLSQDDEIIVRLQRPIMVHITYLTAWALRRGDVHFRRDAYDRDEELIQAMRAAQGGLPLDMRMRHD